MRKVLTFDDYLNGIKNKDRTILARAITLVESQNSEHQALAQKLLKAILPLTGNSKRIGISGTPGVGKSTFIESFGKHLTSLNKSVAVLAVDPTSQVSGGSILGDKTRMNELAIDPLAYIRPSPSGSTLGGVARRTRESMLLCEAFGFDYILIETVGVGQSETVVAQMTDVFMMLLQPGSGDDLQGIKRGILEVVDMVVVTKDDGDNQKLISKAKHDYSKALNILRHDSWIPPVLSCSAVTKSGITEIKTTLDSFFEKRSEEITKKRNEQNIDWMWQLVFDSLKDSFTSKMSEGLLNQTLNELNESKLTSPQAAEILLKEFFKKI